MKWARGSKTWYTHTGPVKECIPPKLTPWVTQATLTGRGTAVVIEVCGDQPEGDVEVHLHAIIVFNCLACRWHNNVMWAFGRAAAGHFANTLMLCECSTYFVPGYILPDTYFIHGYVYICFLLHVYIYILPIQKCFKLLRCHRCVTCVTPTLTACHIQTLAQRPHLNQIRNPQKWKAIFVETGSKTTYKNEEVVLGIVYQELQVSSTSSSSRTLPPNPHLSGVG